MDYGIKVSDEGINALEATGQELFLSIGTPQAKLDTTNSVSFQNISITFVNEPPDAPLGTSVTTLIYEFDHGYTYKPQIWNLVENPSGTPFAYQYFQEGGIVMIGSTTTQWATIDIEVTASKVKYSITKGNYIAGTPPVLLGSTLKIRTYVFVDEA